MSTSNSDEGLKRVIGVYALTISLIGGVIGAGIFALPADVSKSLGAFGVFSYLFCGIAFASILFCYAEIGSRVTTSGGSYAYVEAAFGKFAGFLTNWMYFVGWGIVGSAALENIIADSLAALFPFLAGPVARGFLFFILTGILVVTNIFGTKEGVGVVKIISTIKLLPLFGIMIFGISHINPANLRWNHVPTVGAFGDVTLLLFFAFAGFESCLGASGEIKNPHRTVPLSICIAGVFVLAAYSILQTVTQGVLGTQMTVYQDAPLAAVADKIIGPAGATVLLVCAILSSFGNVGIDLLSTPRSIFAGANDGLFPKFLGRVHPKYATPYLAVISYGTLVFLCCLAGGFKELALMSSAMILLVYLMVILSTLKLRKKKLEGDDKAFRAPGGLVTPIVGIILIVWMLSNLHKQEIQPALIFIAFVCILYVFMNWMKKKSDIAAANQRIS